MLEPACKFAAWELMCTANPQCTAKVRTVQGDSEYEGGVFVFVLLKMANPQVCLVSYEWRARSFSEPAPQHEQQGHERSEAKRSLQHCAHCIRTYTQRAHTAAVQHRCSEPIAADSVRYLCLSHHRLGKEKLRKRTGPTMDGPTNDVFAPRALVDPREDQRDLQIPVPTHALVATCSPPTHPTIATKR